MIKNKETGEIVDNWWIDRNNRLIIIQDRTTGLPVVVREDIDGFKMQTDKYEIVSDVRSREESLEVLTKVENEIGKFKIYDNIKSKSDFAQLLQYRQDLKWFLKEESE